MFQRNWLLFQAYRSNLLHYCNVLCSAMSDTIDSGSNFQFLKRDAVFEWFVMVDKLTKSDTRRYETILQNFIVKTDTCNILKQNNFFKIFFFSSEEKSNLFLVQKIQIKNSTEQRVLVFDQFFLHQNISKLIKYKNQGLLKILW